MKPEWNKTNRNGIECAKQSGTKQAAETNQMSFAQAHRWCSVLHSIEVDPTDHIVKVTVVVNIVPVLYR
jgi:hypothetical protein